MKKSRIYLKVENTKYLKGELFHLAKYIRDVFPKGSEDRYLTQKNAY